MGIRSKIIPHVDGSAVVLASSPKSLSKVSKIRSSRAAHASSSGSPLPGAAVLIQTTSFPAALSAVTAAPGKFSFARNRMSGRAGLHLLRAQCIACIGKTRDNVIVRDIWVMSENISLGPAIREQTDHKFHRKSGPTDHRLPSEHVGRHRNARMIRHGDCYLLSGGTLPESGALRDPRIATSVQPGDVPKSGCQTALRADFRARNELVRYRPVFTLVHSRLMMRCVAGSRALITNNFFWVASSG
jgi:hypothetical protein